MAEDQDVAEGNQQRDEEGPPPYRHPMQEDHRHRILQHGEGERAEKDERHEQHPADHVDDARERATARPRSPPTVPAPAARDSAASVASSSASSTKCVSAISSRISSGRIESSVLKATALASRKPWFARKLRSTRRAKVPGCARTLKALRDRIRMAWALRDRSACPVRSRELEVRGDRSATRRRYRRRSARRGSPRRSAVPCRGRSPSPRRDRTCGCSRPT